MAALTYLLMMFRSRLKSILHAAPADTNTPGLRKRYLEEVLPSGSIACRRRRRVCDEATSSALSVTPPLSFSWHPWRKSHYDELRSRAAGDILRRISHRSQTTEPPVRRVANPPWEKQNVLFSNFPQESSVFVVSESVRRSAATERPRPRGVQGSRVK